MKPKEKSCGADKSYGIDVAQLAWLPKVILDQARKNLKVLQENHLTSPVSPPNRRGWDVKVPPCEGGHPNEAREGGNSLFTPTPLDSTPHPEYEKIKSILSSFDINTITPLQALQLLDKLKGEL